MKDGWVDKYVVSRRDGKDVYPTDKHYDCRLFVLDITHDVYARRAALAYAAACRADLPLLSDDITREVEDAIRYDLDQVAARKAAEKE